MSQKLSLHQASRQKAKLRLGLAGPSGSGKTYSALMLAHGIYGDWNKIALIDTENGSGELYSHLGAYQVLTLQAPFNPEAYIEALHVCEQAKMEVIIVDSITHEWSGKGGCLELHDAETNKMKIPNSFTAWAKITPRHDAFVQALLQSPAHIITTVRSKTEYVLVDRNGRNVPQKAGMGQITRDGFEYELTVSFDLNQDHQAFASKDRTGLFMDKQPAVITASTGQKLLEWSSIEDKAEKEQITKIKGEISRTGTKLVDMLNYFRAESISDLSRLQAVQCLEILAKKPDAKSEPTLDRSESQLPEEERLKTEAIETTKPDDEDCKQTAITLPDGTIVH